MRCRPRAPAPAWRRTRSSISSAVGRLVSRIQREIQSQHVDAWLAENKQRPPLRILVDQRTHLILRQIASLRHMGSLNECVGWADIRVEPAGGLGDGVYWHGRIVG